MSTACCCVGLEGRSVEGEGGQAPEEKLSMQARILQDPIAEGMVYLDLSPLFLSGSDHWSSKVRPFSLRSAVKLISSLGEDSKVQIRVQGLDSRPALLTATTPIGGMS